MAEWREQYNRVKRRHALLDATTVDDRCADDFRAFFIECYHLKDYVKNDPTVPESVRAGVEGFIDSHRAMSLCADVANSAKHSRLDRRSRIDRTTRMEHLSEAVHNPSEPGGVGFRDTVVVLTGQEHGTYWDAQEVADYCVAQWEFFLSQHGLI